MKRKSKGIRPYTSLTLAQKISVNFTEKRLKLIAWIKEKGYSHCNMCAMYNLL